MHKITSALFQRRCFTCFPNVPRRPLFHQVFEFAVDLALLALRPAFVPPNIRVRQLPGHVSVARFALLAARVCQLIDGRSMFPRPIFCCFSCDYLPNCEIGLHAYARSILVCTLAGTPYPT